jgi:hypothetical protein
VKSDKVFRSNLNQALNRITDATVDDVAHEVWGLQEPLEDATEYNPNPWTRRQRFDHMVTTIVDKASREQAFVTQYATFVKRSVPDLQAEVVKKTTDDFNFNFANTHESDPDDFTLIATGSARFFAVLSALDVIRSDDYCEALVRLMAHIHLKMYPAAIEMLLGFVMTAGKTVIRDVSERAPIVWRQLDEAMHRPQLKRRLHFMFVDIDEKRREWMEGVSPAKKPAAGPRRSNEAIGEVRNAFSTFMDGTDVACNLAVPDFLRAALELHLDHVRDHWLFIQFICTVLEQKGANPLDAKAGLIERVQICKQMQLERDCPTLWPITSDLLYMMLIKGQLRLQDAKDIRNCYPDAPNVDWTPEPGMKWFLYDCYEFQAPVEVDNFFSTEIRDALAMPRTIENPPPSIPMSRLIAVALVRSIREKLAYSEGEIKIGALQKWKGLIALAIKKQEQTTREELQKLVEYLEVRFEVDEIVQYCLR